MHMLILDAQELNGLVVKHWQTCPAYFSGPDWEGTELPAARMKRALEGT